MNNSLNLDFINGINRIAFAARCGFQSLDPWQRDVLTTDSNRLLLNCGRQVGKSTVSSLLAAHLIIYEAPCEVVLISPSLNQSMELYKRLRMVYEKIPDAPRPVQESLTRLELDNGSRVLSLPGSEKTSRGLTANAIIVDEASRVEDSIFDAVLPMIATKADGKVVALSTPAGTRGWFWEQWTKNDNWKKVEIKSADCPRIGKAFLDEQLATLGPTRFESEFCCVFHDSIGGVELFTDAMLEGCLTDEFEPIPLG